MERRWKPGSSLDERIRPYARLLSEYHDRELRGDRLTPYQSFIVLWAKGKLHRVAQAQERRG